MRRERPSPYNERQQRCIPGTQALLVFLVRRVPSQEPATPCFLGTRLQNVDMAILSKPQVLAQMSPSQGGLH